MEEYVKSDQLLRSIPIISHLINRIEVRYIGQIQDVNLLNKNISHSLKKDGRRKTKSIVQDEIF